MSLQILFPPSTEWDNKAKNAEVNMGPRIHSHDLIWKSGLGRQNKVKMKSCAVGWETRRQAMGEEWRAQQGRGEEDRQRVKGEWLGC